MAFDKTPPKSGLEAIRVALREWTLNPKYRAAEIRDAMLACLGKVDPKHHLLRRIRYLSDLEGLWYVRAELWLAVAAAQGEEQATRRVSEITRLFGGRVPDGMKPRDKQAVARELRSRHSIPSRESTNFMTDGPDAAPPGWGATIPMSTEWPNSWTKSST